MSSGFWAGAVPPWAYVVGACLWVLAVLLGMWAGYGRGWKHAEEEQRWAREQAKARRTHPVYRQPPELTHEQMFPWAGTANTATGPTEMWLPADETVLDPTAVLTPQDMTFTGEFRLRLAEFERDMAGLIGGTDEQLREITR